MAAETHNERRRSPATGYRVLISWIIQPALEYIVAPDQLRDGEWHTFGTYGDGR